MIPEIDLSKTAVGKPSTEHSDLKSVNVEKLLEFGFKEESQNAFWINEGGHTYSLKIPNTFRFDYWVLIDVPNDYRPYVSGMAYLSRGRTEYTWSELLYKLDSADTERGQDNRKPWCENLIRELVEFDAITLLEEGGISV